MLYFVRTKVNILQLFLEGQLENRRRTKEFCVVKVNFVQQEEFETKYGGEMMWGNVDF